LFDEEWFSSGFDLGFVDGVVELFLSVCESFRGCSAKEGEYCKSALCAVLAQFHVVEFFDDEVVLAFSGACPVRAACDSIKEEENDCEGDDEECVHASFLTALRTSCVWSLSVNPGALSPIFMGFHLASAMSVRKRRVLFVVLWVSTGCV